MMNLPLPVYHRGFEFNLKHLKGATIMPHDKNGNKVRVGDLVVLKGRVSSVNPSEDACNCNVQIDNGKESHQPEVVMNTKALERYSSESVQEAAERGFYGPAGKPKKKTD